MLPEDASLACFSFSSSTDSMVAAVTSPEMIVMHDALLLQHSQLPLNGSASQCQTSTMSCAKQLLTKGQGKDQILLCQPVCSGLLNAEFRLRRTIASHRRTQSLAGVASLCCIFHAICDSLKSRDVGLELKLKLGERRENQWNASNSLDLDAHIQHLRCA